MTVLPYAVGMRLISVFIGLWCVVLCAGVAGAQPAASTRDLRVMSFNIRYGTADDGPNHWTLRRGMLIELLRTQQADVIGVQEALHAQLQEVVAALPEYGLVGVGRADGKEAGEYSAILYRTSRLTPLASGTFWFSDTPEVVASRSWGNEIERICTWARFEDRTGGRFYAYNLHLDHRSQPSRERSVQLLRARILARPSSDPIIVTGDFNAGEDNAAVRALREASTLPLVDTFRVRQAAASDVGTFTAFKFGQTQGDKIDYVFVESSTEVIAAEIVRTSRDERYPSDHFPVTATIRFKRP